MTNRRHKKKQKEGKLINYLKHLVDISGAEDLMDISELVGRLVVEGGEQLVGGSAGGPAGHDAEREASLHFRQLGDLDGKVVVYREAEVLGDDEREKEVERVDE
ncbi:unnamed protein product [Linum trigynum]|uniref:Uncharacterized protein n=1 Tax=Linum trigynum TaxID=586398 RepID=A0AAV2DDD9_9ROSI